MEHEHNCSTHYHARAKCDCGSKEATPADAILLAHAAGFAGTSWIMGPEELAHLLNVAKKTPNVRSQEPDAASSRQVACTDGLGGRRVASADFWKGLMMDNRELLELAAKAAGYQLDGMFTAKNPDDMLVLNDRGGHSVWNPLAYDGDALRMAVRLRIDFQFDGEKVEAWFVAPRPGWDNGAVWSWSEPLGDDPYAATRRVIVLAAAEMAKNKTPNANHPDRAR